ncbi:MAG TPA: prolyl oligopeptidase family serine peptidase [Gemmatales bacterium]|nr:prolyl oligopeptidase family serine peptidase [Gemmatales bacterium]
MHRLSLTLIFLTSFGSLVSAQGTRADYERAAGLAQRYQGKVLNARPKIVWQGDGKYVVYRQQRENDKHAFLRIDLQTGQRSPTFDHQSLAADLAIHFKKSFDVDKLPFTEIEVNNDGSVIYFTLEGRHWEYDRFAGTIKHSEIVVSPMVRRTPPRLPGYSLDGQWSFTIKDYNVVLTNIKTKTEEVLTKDGTAAEPYVRQFYWSPNSRKAIFLKVKPAQEHKVYLIESSPSSQLQPKLHETQYLKPGDEVAKPTLYLFDVPTRHIIKINNKLFPNPYSLSDYSWQKDSSRFTFQYNQRGHQVYRWLAVDADTGHVTTLIDEQSKTFIDYAGKHYLHQIDPEPRTIVSGSSTTSRPSTEAIWMSERDGWNHLYLYDTKRGEVKKQLTQGQWVVRRVVKADDVKRQLWFTCGGFYVEQDPYYLHLGRVNYDGSGLTILTTADASHATELSPNGEYFVDSYSRVDLAPVTEIRSVQDGKLVAEVEKADLITLKSLGWRAPERFVAKARDGVTNIYGVIHRPTNFSPTKKYPVIEFIYAGPQDAFVPKDFRPFYRQQTIADLGFIVVQMDGMGTSQRSKAFHDVCWKNLGDAGFPDRIAWIKAAAERYPYMDLTRVGIYGGSAGGQNALRGMLMYPDFYKVGVADCGCHDNRMDKIWWNELWMSWPIGPHYAEQSNVTQAHRLQGKLLLTVGELDRNVDPASTMQVVNALIKANKDFDMLVIPGGGHGVAETPYGARRRQDFFVRHLLDVEPRGK